MTPAADDGVPSGALSDAYQDRLLVGLNAWLPRQRWYAAKGRDADELRLRILTGWDLPTAEPGVRARIEIIADESAVPPVVYQLPVVLRPADAVPSGVPGSAVIATAADGLAVIDGPRDPAGARALLQAIDPHLPILEPQVLTGEQSNTSIVFTPAEAAAGRPVICKVFRQLQPGVNPDVELATALAGAGSPHVPAARGHATASWPAPDGTEKRGTLAFAQEFLAGVEDAWRVARRAAADGESFAAAAHALGAATADVHRSLAALFPQSPADADARAAIAATWARRLDIAETEVPEIARHRDAIEAVYRRAEQDAWPALQRIHGDYHLGQVLQVPGRGWVLLDFEGEPLRPIAERRAPDLTGRDIAGMLRSFDYVAGSLGHDDPTADGAALAAWASEARAAFLGGYRAHTVASTPAALLDAFELEKAVYEAIYEARNRPAWLQIPLAAVARLVGGPPAG